MNTQVEDENGSTWKEMKLGLVFCDEYVIKKDKDSHILLIYENYTLIVILLVISQQNPLDMKCTPTLNTHFSKLF